MGTSGPDNLFVDEPLNAYPNPSFQAARLARVNRVPAVDIDITGEVQERALVADIEKVQTVLRKAESFAQSAHFMDLQANAPQRALQTLQQIQTLRAQHSKLVREYEKLQTRRAESKSFKSRILHGRGATGDTTMRAISVPQPFASAILYGIQTIVNRTAEASLPPAGAWFALHASRKDASNGRALFADAWVQRTQKPLVLAQLPKGAILGFVHVAHCVQKERCNASFALGPYCFLVDDVLALDTPYHIPGQQGLWEVPQQVVHLFNQLRATVHTQSMLPPCTTAPAGGASFHSNCLRGSTSADPPNVAPPAVPAPPLVPLFTAASASTPPVEVSSLASCSSMESPRCRVFAAGGDLKDERITAEEIEAELAAIGLRWKDPESTSDPLTQEVLITDDELDVGSHERLQALAERMIGVDEEATLVLEEPSRVYVFYRSKRGSKQLLVDSQRRAVGASNAAAAEAANDGGAAAAAPVEDETAAEAVPDERITGEEIEAELAALGVRWRDPLAQDVLIADDDVEVVTQERLYSLAERMIGVHEEASLVLESPSIVYEFYRSKRGEKQMLVHSHRRDSDGRDCEYDASDAGGPSGETASVAATQPVSSTPFPSQGQVLSALTGRTADLPTFEPCLRIPRDLMSCGIAPTPAPEAARGSHSFQGSPAPAVDARASPPESCAPLTTMPSLAEASIEELVPGPAPTEPASQASVGAAPAAATAPPSHSRACPSIAKGQYVFVELEYPRANICTLARGSECPRALGDDTFELLRLQGIADSALHPDAPADYDHFNKHDESSELLRVVLPFAAVPTRWRPIQHMLFAPSLLKPGGSPMYDSMLIDADSNEILFDLSYNTYGLFWFHQVQQPILVPEQESNMYKLQIYACRNARLLHLGRSIHEPDQPIPAHATASPAPAPPPAASRNVGQEPFSDASFPAPVPATARSEGADLLPPRLYRRADHPEELVRYNPRKEIATRAAESVRQLSNDHRLNVPVGFPEGPIPGDSEELLQAVNTYCKDVTTGNGGHGVKFASSAAPPPLNSQARGFTRWVRCSQFRQNDDTSCKWRVQFELSTCGWVLVSCPTAEHSHALLQTEAQSMAAASTRMGVPKELWPLGHALARAGKSAGCMHGVLLKAAYDQNLCTQFDTQDIRRRFGEQRGDRALDATNLTSFLQDRVSLVSQPTNPNPSRHTMRAQARAPP